MKSGLHREEKVSIPRKVHRADEGNAIGVEHPSAQGLLAATLVPVLGDGLLHARTALDHVTNLLQHALVQTRPEVGSVHLHIAYLAVVPPTDDSFAAPCTPQLYIISISLRDCTCMQELLTLWAAM